MWWKLSGEYWKTISVDVSAASCLQSVVPRTARSVMPVAVEAEDDPPLRHRGRVVEVDDRAPRTVDRLVGALDQLGPGLRQHRDRDVVRDQVLVDERAHEVEVRLRGGREADLDLLDPERDQEVEEPPLATGVHRVDERLVPVAEVGRAPDRRAASSTTSGQVRSGSETVS